MIEVQIWEVLCFAVYRRRCTCRSEFQLVLVLAEDRTATGDLFLDDGVVVLSSRRCCQRSSSFINGSVVATSPGTAAVALPSSTAAGRLRDTMPHHREPPSILACMCVVCAAFQAFGKKCMSQYKLYGVMFRGLVRNDTFFRGANIFF